MKPTTYSDSEEIRALLSRFTDERKWLQNVTPKTIALYHYSFQAFAGALDSLEDVKGRIAQLRQRGLSPVSVNTYVRHVKSFYLWQGKDFKLPVLKEEQRILLTLTTPQLRQLMDCKPNGVNLRRALILALVISDCGLRAAEVLRLTEKDVELDQMIFKVLGKGGKHRLVPFSAELRKRLWRYFSDIKRNSLLNKGNSLPTVYLFGTKNNTPLSVRNFERDLKCLGQQINIGHLHPHLLRHTFSVMYLRHGGNLEFLRRILGHSSILTTQKYLRSLGVEDLSAVHQALSPLSSNGR